MAQGDGPIAPVTRGSAVRPVSLVSAWGSHPCGASSDNRERAACYAWHRTVSSLSYVKAFPTQSSHAAPKISPQRVQHQYLRHRQIAPPLGVSRHTVAHDASTATLDVSRQRGWPVEGGGIAAPAPLPCASAPWALGGVLHASDGAQASGALCRYSTVPPVSHGIQRCAS